MFDYSVSPGKLILQMRLFVAITDSDWFGYLSELRPDEVNFWQPSASSSFRALSHGEPLLFKLHSPNDYIVGGGFFSHHTVLPASFAWTTFGPKNGAATEDEMRRRIERYRRVEPNASADYSVGCILLQSPFFFSREEWLPVPDWRREIVRGKGYTTDDEVGKRLWTEIELRLQAQSTLLEETAVGDDSPRFGQPQTVLSRLGQGTFRVIVTDVYKRQCAVTNSHVLHVLDAAHIRPYAQGGTHSPSNGLLLRQDVHTLFDRGYLTVTPDYRVEVSHCLKDEFDNGKEYYALQGRNIVLPESPVFRPSEEQLIWHNENVYRP
jgi:putative restriction endonuclease